MYDPLLFNFSKNCPNLYQYWPKMNKILQNKVKKEDIWVKLAGLGHIFTYIGSFYQHFKQE